MKSNENHLVEIEPSRLQKNKWNTNIVSPENQEKLKQVIADKGFIDPVLIRTLDDGSLEILGGEHRVAAAKELGLKNVPCINVGIVSEQYAKELSVMDNSRYGTDDSLSFADLVKDFDTDFLLNLPFSDDEMNSILSSSSIDLDSLGFDEEEENLPELPDRAEAEQQDMKTHQLMRFKVPLADAHKVNGMIEKIIKQQQFIGEDSLTNAGDALVFLCLKK